MDSRRRLHELLDFVLDGSCTDDQRTEFSRLIDAHPDLVEGLAEELFLHSLLQWHSEDIAGDLQTFGLTTEWGDAGVSPDSLPAEGVGRAASPTASTAWRSRGVLAVAAALLLAGTVLVWQTPERDSLQEDAVAMIIDETDVAWVGGSTALHDRQFVVPGRLQTTAGSFTMKFRSGPTVRVNGAASMMIESDMLVHLDRGQATARVPDELKGFTIKTPVINVIDQGTEFGVATRDDGFTDVIVFDGKVDLEDSINRRGVPKRLGHGEAARVNRQGLLQRIMQVGRDPQGGWWTVDYPASASHVIKEVRDNIPPSDGSKYFCYQLTLQGLKEDAPAYGDRHPHEWNGLTAEGLPKFLIGADYVKTFNDYRYINDFEMGVELSQPANLFIFFDDRVPTPEWLVERFVDTGVDIGLDEGPWEGIPDHRVAVGGGKSIDNVFSVWHRRCEELAPVTLGPVGPTKEARAMYGIAATPLHAPVPVEAPLEQD